MAGPNIDDIDLQILGELQQDGRMTNVELARKGVLSGAVTLKSDSFLNSILLKDWATYGDSFQEFLTANRLSSHMWVVAQRL